MATRIFISHRSLDGSFAAALSRLLTAAGVPTYLDTADPTLQDAPRADEVTAAIERGLAISTHLIAIISPFSRSSWWVPYEIAVARKHGREIVAVVQDGVREPEYLTNARVLRTLDALIEWVHSVATIHPGADGWSALREDLYTWFSAGTRSRAHVYRAAIDHLESLWDPQTWKALRLEDEGYAFSGRWMGCKSPQLIHVLYSLIAPMVALYPQTAGLSELERAIIDALYKSFANDEVFARLDPGLPYEARRCADWRAKRAADPRQYWLQGLLPRDLDAARAAFRDERGQLLSRDALAQKYMALYSGSDGRAQKPLGLAANALQGFELDTRPVFARLIAAQVQMYNALLKLEQNEARARRHTLFDLQSGSALGNTEESIVAKTYLREQVFPELARAIGADVREFSL
jgi:hypothetical protein